MGKLVFGCGYLGLRVARSWRANGDAVYAVTRSQSRATDLNGVGITPIVADVTSPASLQGLPDVDTVLFAVGFDRSSGHSIQQIYVEGLRNTLKALPSSPKRFLYISSTGVYGQDAGEWVDESSPCEPTREGGKACLEAEQLLAEHPVGGNSIVLRLAGIYGPGRIPRRESLEQGEPISAPSEGYLNLIHVDDAVQIVLECERQPAPQTFVVSDGCPVPRCDYFRELARLLGCPAPTFKEPAEGSPAAIRATTNKRICNARMQKELGVSLLHPSYREGLAAIVANSER